MAGSTNTDIIEELLYSNEIIDINIINGILAADKDGYFKDGRTVYQKIVFTGEIQYNIKGQKAAIVADQEIVNYLKMVRAQRSKNC